MPASPTLTTEARAIVAEHHELGRYLLELAGDPELLFCENETNAPRLFGMPGTDFPKDGINDHVVHGADTVNPGTVGHARRRLAIDSRSRPGETAEVRFQLGPAVDREEDSFDDILSMRRAEADSFYARLTPPAATEDEARVLRQAFAGMLWSKQFFHYDVARWLEGDPAGAPPPPERSTRPQQGVAPRRLLRRHLDAGHVGVPVVRGVGPCVPLRRPRPRRRGLREAPAAPAAAASGTSIRTDSYPHTSGRSATSTRRSTHGPRSKCFASTAGATSAS